MRCTLVLWTATLVLSFSIGCSLLLDSAEDPCADPRSCTAAPSPSTPAPAPDVGKGCPKPCPDDAKQCDARDGTCVQCTLDEHCPSGHCDPDARRCTGCLEDVDCASLSGREHCDVETESCVQCLGNGDCPSGEVCSADHNCVGCLVQRDCTDAARPRCDARSASCAGCKSDSDCTHIEGRRFCHLPEGECVECTIEHEDVCGGQVCNDMHRCTDVRRGNVKRCEPCKFDSECSSGDRPLAERDHRCVPTSYRGRPRGAFCLQVADLPCERPYTVVIPNLTSLSGAQAASYCGIDQMRTTCEAVHEGLKQGCSQATDPQCGAPDLPDDAVCLPTTDANAFMCTYRCTRDDQCPEGAACASDMYCQ